MADYGLSTAMKESLRRNTVELVSSLENIPEIMDHLVADDVFHETDDVLHKPTRKDRVRKLLDYIYKRPAKDYWTFMRCLYYREVKQGHIAEKILLKLEEAGATVTDAEVRRLRRDYQESLGNQQLTQHSPENQRQEFPQPPPSDFQLQSSLNAAAAWSMQGLPVTEEGCGVGTTDTDAGNNSLLPLSRYEEERQKDSEKVYRMESIPRGKMLIINNEEFQHLEKRSNTNRDRDHLLDLFGNYFRYEITIKEDLKGKEMKKELISFATSLSSEHDSCVVAILTHGYNNGVLFGTDGRLQELSNNSYPEAQTYVTVDELRCIFSSSKCQAMQGKPKMMIIQACKGNRNDSTRSQTVQCDVVFERMPEQPEDNLVSNLERQDPDRADVVFIDATVDNYVAYRNVFIDILDRVFRTHAHSEHILELHTQVASEMSKARLEGHIFTISEGTTTLRKKFFLNPPGQYE